MENWLIAIIGLAICIAAVLVVSAIKVIIKKVKKNEIDMKKAEYPLAAVSMVLAYGGVVVFLYFGVMDDIKTALKLAAPFAMSVQTLYIFVVQLARKGFSGALAAIKNIVSKLKTSKHPIKELLGIVKESTAETETEAETNDKIGEKLYDEIFKETK